MKPIISHEVIIHCSDPVLTVPIRYTIYARESLINNLAHRLMSRMHPDYDWFIIGEMDRDDLASHVESLAVLRGIFWTGHIEGMEDYYPLLDGVRGAALNCLADLFPLAVFPDQDDL